MGLDEQAEVLPGTIGNMPEHLVEFIGLALDTNNLWQAFVEKIVLKQMPSAEQSLSASEQISNIKIRCKSCANPGVELVRLLKGKNVSAAHFCDALVAVGKTALVVHLDPRQDREYQH